jgi:hypothetical protein
MAIHLQATHRIGEREEAAAARQRHSKQVSMATNKQATTEKLLEAVVFLFSPCQV